FALAMDRRRCCARRRIAALSRGGSSGGFGLGARRGAGLAMAAACALELRSVEKRFGATEIIRGVSLEVARGERHAIIGPNGAGKSTLFNLVSGRFALSAGRITLGGADLGGLAPYEINRKGLSRSFQVTIIFHNLTVYENLRCAVLWAH